MNKYILYKKAYRILENSTPLKINCGALCGSKCCKGDSNMGMCLFPNEELMIHDADFLNFRNKKLGDSDVLFSVCSGICDRKMRPLSCRIYPFTPYLSDSGYLSIIADPRAKYHCPLLMYSDIPRVNKFFIRDLVRVFRQLIQDDEIKRHISSLSRELDEYIRFTNRNPCG